jgi:Mn2+/Fe2+ NRAMP family transporter
MADAPRLPRSLMEWICLFGPGAIMASLTIGTGELVFSTRGGALFGYRILFVFAIVSLLKWTLVICTSRHMILTGVHPYERMLDLPGPRGWLPIMLLLVAVVCMPIWISFHSGVLGNLTAWVTNTRQLYHGGIDYILGAGILASVLILAATGGYSVLERVQTFVVLAMVACAGLTLVLYRPDWLQLLFGIVPQPLEYPPWLADRYPEIAKYSVWVETTRYMGVIGGAGFDYLAYTSWLREKSWGILPERATPRQLEQIAADPNHEVRKWINAPIVDCSISFILVVLFSAVFVASGTMFLGPAHVVPDESNLLNLQAKFVTQIHPWLLPLYIVGAFLTMLGTLYGTVEIACSVSDEIVRSFVKDWSPDRAKQLRRGVITWCASIAFLILGWLFIRQANTDASSTSTPAVAATTSTAADSELSKEVVKVEKPRLLLAVMTPVNLLTGVLSCGLICMVTAWMDRKLPVALRPPFYLSGLNLLAGTLFLSLGVKGLWENGDGVAFAGILVLFATAILIATLCRPMLMRQPLTSSLSSRDAPS